ncbi:hypothetical protein GCM10022285_42750 [Streptomyces tunisiensis]|uniref:Uncharacterized protein n=1 Tax=Streptomyces tunisiensis TaxID=948699 RepID=A0ABP7YV75_9ACTN
MSRIALLGGGFSTDGRLTEVVTRSPGARLYRVRADGEAGAVEEAVPCRLLGG